MRRVDDYARFVETLELLDERRALQAQQSRRLPFVAAGALERSLDQFALDVGDERVEIDAVFGQRDGRRRRARFLRLLNLGRQIADVDLRSSGRERHRALDGVLELADVARPVIRHQPAHAFLRDGQRRARSSAGGLAAVSGTVAVAAGVALLLELAEEVLHEQRHVLLPLAQRRQLHRDHVQPVEQILAELSFGDEPAQVAVGRGDDADVDLDRVRIADALELALLQHAQQLHLQRRAHRADFVEEERALVRLLERPWRLPTAPVNAPRTWPKSSASSSVSGIALQFSATNRCSAPRAVVVDRARDDFLARARSRR